VPVFSVVQEFKRFAAPSVPIPARAVLVINPRRVICFLIFIPGNIKRLNESEINMARI
jgi:hypothetical protein